LDRAEHKRVVAQADQAQRQPPHGLHERIAQLGPREGSPRVDRGSRRHAPVIPGDHTHIFVTVMAKLEFSAAVTAKASPERAFDYFADHRHVAEVLEGVSRWEPIGGKTRGTGARYRVEMRALGLPLHTVLRLNRW